MRVCILVCFHIFNSEKLFHVAFPLFVDSIIWLWVFHPPIVLRYVPPYLLGESFYHDGCCILSGAFSVSADMIMWLSFLLLTFQCIILIDSHCWLILMTLDWVQLSYGVSSFLLYCWICWFVNILSGEILCLYSSKDVALTICFCSSVVCWYQGKVAS